MLQLHTMLCNLKLIKSASTVFIRYKYLHPALTGPFFRTVNRRFTARNSIVKCSFLLPTANPRHFSSSPSTLSSKMSAATSFYELQPEDNQGTPFSFAQLKGKVVLIVNVASKCGFTPQYAGLQELYDKYHDRGLEIIGFPCNQFAHQEPGTSEEIAQFCQKNYGVTFPVLNKIDVNGSHADPVYQFLKSKKSGFFGFKGIKWNFEKFLVDRNGEVVERWASTSSPASLNAAIEKALDQPIPTPTTTAADPAPSSNAGNL